MPVIHDLACPKCGQEVRNHVFPTIASLDLPVACFSCGAVLEIRFNSSYNRTFGGQLNCLNSQKIVVYEHPDGRIEYPGRADAPMPKRYRDQGFQRREILPSEVTAFEKKNHVTCESLHWGSKGMNAPSEDPVPELKIEDVPLVQ